MRTSYGYEAYRGRSKLRTFFMVVIAILLVVLLLAVAAFFLLQQYFVYTDDGLQIHVPWLQQEEDDLPPETPGQNIVIVTPEPTAPPAPQVLTVVELPASALTDGTALEQMEAAQGNAVLFDMKGDDGKLNYVSALPQAVSLKTSAADPQLNDAIRELTADEQLYTIARVSCFRDNAAPQMDRSLSITTNSGYNWRDTGDVRWTNVAVPETRAYVAGVCRELAELGFDEILLDNAAYPTSGHLEYIKKGDVYDTDNLTEPVEEFYRQVAQVLAEYPEVRLSIAVAPAVMTGEGDRSGQTPELLGEYADHLFVPAPGQEGAYDEALTAAGLEAERLVYTTAPGWEAENVGRLISREN